MDFQQYLLFRMQEAAMGMVLGLVALGVFVVVNEWRSRVRPPPRTPPRRKTHRG